MSYPSHQEVWWRAALRGKTSGRPLARCSWGALFLLMAGGQADAQWQVTDKATHDGLKKVEGTIKGQTNKRLEEIRDQDRIGPARRSTDGAQDAPGMPSVALDKGRPVAIQSTIPVEELRCGAAPAAGMLRDRWTVCREIVKTELAQYQYALSMREVALQRQSRLRRIEDERARLQGQDAGKLQSNSNELLALLARMEADRQQYRTYMDAYQARITYLHGLGEALGHQVIGGSDRSGTPGAAVGGGALAALKLALRDRRTESRSAGSGK